MEQISALDRQVEHFFYVLFGEEVPKSIKARYRGAHQHMFKRSCPNETHTVEVVVQERLDAGAVESFLRRKGTPHLLTMKMQLIIYLSELSPTHCDLFVNQTDSRSRAVAAIITSSVKWPYSIIKGAYLTWRYELV